MAKRDKDIKEGFTGMDFTKKSQLFDEMPEWKPKYGKRPVNPTTPKDTPKDTSKDDRTLAKEFIDDNYNNLIVDLNASELESVISALVEYKK